MVKTDDSININQCGDYDKTWANLQISHFSSSGGNWTECSAALRGSQKYLSKRGMVESLIRCPGRDLAKFGFGDFKELLKFSITILLPRGVYKYLLNKIA